MVAGFCAAIPIPKIKTTNESNQSWRKIQLIANSHIVKPEDFFFPEMESNNTPQTS
jgi:hypothetical protein